MKRQLYMHLDLLSAVTAKGNRKGFAWGFAEVIRVYGASPHYWVLRDRDVGYEYAMKYLLTEAERYRGL